MTVPSVFEWALLVLSAATLTLVVDMICPDGVGRVVAGARRRLSKALSRKWRLDKDTWTWRREW